MKPLATALTNRGRALVAAFGWKLIAWSSPTKTLRVGIPAADRGDFLTEPEDEWPITGDSPL